MGPYQSEIMRELAVYRRQHPQVIIKSPSETYSRLWEVSLPSSATMAFDDPEMMLRALSMTTIPEDD